MTAPRPYDPERGLRGAMSGTLILETIALLLAIPVAKNTGAGTNAAGIIAICALAAAHVAMCVYVRRTWFVPVVFVLQVLVVAGWAISGPLGVLGVVFLLVWIAEVWFRQEFRRRSAAGTLPVPPEQRPPA
jgi:hypothetical protein